MNIPNYQKLFKPVLEVYADNKEHSLQDAVTIISDKLQLTAEEKALRTSSGQRVIHNRVSWAHTYLRHAGLITTVSRGICKITPLGHQVLQENPKTIDNDYLRKFDSFVEFKDRKRERVESVTSHEDDDSDERTPEERLDSALAEHNQSLREELLDNLRNVDPIYFEKIVGDLLDVMGYGSVTVTQRTNDGGIDAVVNEDALGLSKIYVQAKRYAANNRINGKEIRDFVGALEMNGVSQGVFITTSSFHERALDDLRSTQKSIILVGGEKLAQLMIDYELGVTIEKAYKYKRLDTDYLSAE